MQKLQPVLVLSIAGALYACGSSTECGTGTTERDGVCVSTGSGGDGNTNTNGNTNNTNDVGNSNLTCGAGTQPEGDECVPVPALGGFTVSAAAVDCDTVVDSVTPLATTVTALDADGATLAGFSGTVTLLGLGGITVSPSSVELTDGSGTFNLTVNGRGDNAVIVAFDSTGRVSGRTAPFPVVAETIELSGLTANTPQLRSGETVELTVDVETNGCRPPPMGATGVVFLSATDGVEISPDQVAFDGTSNLSQTVRVDGSALLATTAVTLTARLGLAGNATSSVSVVPPIVFNGITDAFAVNADTAQISFTAATGGEPPYTYTVFQSAVANSVGSAVAPTITSGTSGTFSIADLSNGDVRFFAVRVTDSLGDPIDNNLVQLSVIKGPVVFVDASNVEPATANGAPATPYRTLSEAIAGLPSGGTVNIAAGSYAELPIDASATANLQIVGGYSGFTAGVTTDASDWVRGDDPTVLSYDGTSSLDTAVALLSTGANTSLSGVDVAPAFDGVPIFAFLRPNGALELRDVLVGAATQFSQRIRGEASALTLVQSTVRAPASGGPTCINLTDSTLTLVDSAIQGCGTAADVRPGTGTQADIEVRGGIIDGIEAGIRVEGGIVTVRGARFQNLTGAAIRASAGAIADIDNSDFINVDRAVLLDSAGGLILTNSQVDGVTEGITGQIQATGRNPIRVQNTTVRTVEGTGMRVTGNVSTGAYDIDVRDNVFSSMGSSSAGIEISVTNNDPLAVHSSVIANNQILDFNAGILLRLTEGDASTNAGEISVASVVDNYGRAFGRDGSGLETSFYSSGSLDAVVQRNRMFGFSSAGIRVYSSADQSIVDVLDNLVEGDREDPGAFMFVDTQTTNLEDGGTTTVQRNTLGSLADVSASTSGGGFLSYNSGGTSVDFIDNILLGTGGAGIFVENGGIAVRDNLFEGAQIRFQTERSSVPEASDRDLSTTLTNNTLTGDDVGIDVFERLGINTNATVRVQNNVVDSDSELGQGRFVLSSLSTNANANGDQDWQVTGNDIRGSQMRVFFNTPSGVAGAQASFAFRDNLQSARSVNSNSTAFRFTLHEQDVAVDIEGNAFITGATYTPPATFNMSNSNTNAQVSIRENLFDQVSSNPGDGAFYHAATNMGPGGSFASRVENNVFSFSDGVANYGIINTRITNAQAVASMDFVHNTIAGDFAFGPEANGNNATSSTISFVDNVIASSVPLEGTSIRDDRGLNGPALVIDNNVVPSATTGAPGNDIIGTAVFVNPVESRLVVIVLDPFSNVVQAVSGGFALGDQVVLDGDPMARQVVIVNGSTATLDGMPIAAATGTVLNALSWSSGTFVSAVPDLNLAPGSPGVGAATDQGDVGAGGGANPFTPPMLPAP